MRAIKHSLLSGIFVAAALVGLAVPNRAQALTPDEAKAIAMDAYVYGYSLITTEVTRVKVDLHCCRCLSLRHVTLFVETNASAHSAKVISRAAASLREAAYSRFALRGSRTV